MEEYIRIVDAHAHLWLRQYGVVDGQTVVGGTDGRAMFLGEERQMLPPFMVDGRNTAVRRGTRWPDVPMARLRLADGSAVGAGHAGDRAAGVA